MAYLPIRSIFYQEYNTQLHMDKQMPKEPLNINVSQILGEDQSEKMNYTASFTNSSLIQGSSRSDSISERDLSHPTITMEKLMKNSLRIEHQREQGYFVREEDMEEVRQVQRYYSRIVPPPRNESNIFHLYDQNSMTKSDSSFQRLTNEQNEQIRQLELERGQMWERSFEKKEKIFAQIPPKQSQEIECHKCPGLMKECSTLNEKIKELQKLNHKERRQKEYYKTKIQKAEKLFKH